MTSTEVSRQAQYLDEPELMAPLPDELRDLPASIPQLLAARRDRPDDVLLAGTGFRLTFGEADQRSERIGRQLLASGIGKGTRLGILFGNGSDWVITWLAAARIGALTVPLSTFSPSKELLRVIKLTDVGAIISDSCFLDADLIDRWEQALPGLTASGPLLQEREVPYLRWIHVVGANAPAWSSALPEPVHPEVLAAAEAEVHSSDSLVVVTTSGVTGTPKAVLHSHGGLLRHAAVIARLRGLTPTDRIYSPLPFFWVGGLSTVLLYAMISGGTAVVQQRFDPAEALDLLEAERVTFVTCWPNAARAIAAESTFADRDLGSIRGGTLREALPPDLRPASDDLYPMPLGMTETGGPHTNPDDHFLPLPERLRATSGRSLVGFEHKVVDPDSGRPLDPGLPGHLLVRGPLLMQGLYKQEPHQVFTPNGWYPTGDLCSIDASGYVRFHGRLNAMIKTAGSNVSPAEVEALLTTIPGVKAAYVFAVPAGDRGQDVAAAVVFEPGASPDITFLSSEARQLMSTYKTPRRWLTLDESDVPMLPTGKVDIPELRRRVQQHEAG